MVARDRGDTALAVTEVVMAKATIRATLAVAVPADRVDMVGVVAVGGEADRRGVMAVEVDRMGEAVVSLGHTTVSVLHHPFTHANQ